MKSSAWCTGVLLLAGIGSTVVASTIEVSFQYGLAHGDEGASLCLRDEIKRHLGWNVAVPEYLDEGVLT